MYIADTTNHAIRIVYTDGTIDTYAGKGPSQGGYSGDGGPARDARLNEPRDVVFDNADGSLFIADTGNHMIRRVAADDSSARWSDLSVAQIPILATSIRFPPVPCMTNKAPPRARCT